MKPILLMLLTALTFSNAWCGSYEDAAAAVLRDDHTRVIEISLPAARQGEQWAQFFLGDGYLRGQGVAQNYSEAIKWFRLAAQQGLSNSQANLGLMYFNGHGVSQDYVKAHSWFNLSAVKGEPDAVKRRDIVASRMTAQQIAEAQKLARDCQAKQFKGCN